ncbi:MAG: VOC family protein [Pseudomonadota bacterium]
MALNINYIELYSTDLTATKTFLSAAFGWVFTDYGPTYASFSKESAGLDGGVEQVEAGEALDGGALLVLHADDLAAARMEALAQGARLTRDIFDFPGGRRFEFTAPGGPRMAVWGT